MTVGRESIPIVTGWTESTDRSTDKTVEQRMFDMILAVGEDFLS